MARSKRVVTRNKPIRKLKPAAQSEVEQLAALYIQARSALVRAGGVLHDHVGSSLSAAGVQLQLLRMDMPMALARIDDTLRILEDTLNRVRDLSRELCPSPAYTGGLKQALLGLRDQDSWAACQVEVDYGVTTPVPAEVAAALYEAGWGAVEQAVRNGASRVTITARGASGVELRVADNGRKSGRTRALSAIRTLARAQGLAFECTTGKGTIVSIRYANRRPPRG